jgi:hypothetical protein
LSIGIIHSRLAGLARINRELIGKVEAVERIAKTKPTGRLPANPYGEEGTIAWASFELALSPLPF